LAGLERANQIYRESKPDFAKYVNKRQWRKREKKKLGEKNPEMLVN